jgi:hypothetical protein
MPYFGGHATCGVVLEVLEVMRGVLEVVQGLRYMLQVLEVVEDMGDVYGRC